MSHSDRTTRLWTDETYRDNQKIARQGSRLRRMETWPFVVCRFCDKKFQVRPCRETVTKFCSRDCQTTFRTGIPNLKNRGKKPSSRAGSGISGTYKGSLFRSLYELSFLINVAERLKLTVEYESIRIPLDSGRSYIPDFVDVTSRIIYEVKYAKALLQPKVMQKIDAGIRYASQNRYEFIICTELTMEIVTFDEVATLVKSGLVCLHQKRNGGARYQRLVKACAVT